LDVREIVKEMGNDQSQCRYWPTVPGLEDCWLWLLLWKLPHAPHSNGVMTTLNPKDGPPQTLEDEVQLHVMDSIIDAIGAAPVVAK
jgi:hypothetical protein